MPDGRASDFGCGGLTKFWIVRGRPSGRDARTYFDFDELAYGYEELLTRPKRPLRSVFARGRGARWTKFGSAPAAGSRGAYRIFSLQNARMRVRASFVWGKGWGVVTVTKKLKVGVFRYFARAASSTFIAIIAGIFLLLTGAEPALAKPGKHNKPVQHAAEKPMPLRAAILIDVETGTVLREINPDTPNYPASLTKMMTLYLTFAALNQGTLDLDQRLAVSPHAARQEPTKLWLKPGDSVRVSNLILALVTRSANDAAVVLAEGIAGSEGAFARRMTSTARRLGMARTVFRNASGLPDPTQRTTARDMARLALALHQDFPREFDYFSVRQFKFRGQTITGHNRLLKTYDGSDGIKTGYTRAAGFNLVASAERDGQRLIGVILGSPSWQVRDKRMAALLDHGFTELDSSQIAAAPDRVVPTKARNLTGTMARLAILASPVGKAQAATVGKPQISPALNTADAARRSVQLGAFRGQTAAKKLARSASRLSAAKGKTVRVVKLPKNAKGRLYTVQLSTFTEKDARNVCTSLKKRMPCFVVPKTDES